MEPFDALVACESPVCGHKLHTKVSLLQQIQQLQTGKKMACKCEDDLS